MLRAVALDKQKEIPCFHAWMVFLAEWVLPSNMSQYWEHGGRLRSRKWLPMSSLRLFSMLACSVNRSLSHCSCSVLLNSQHFTLTLRMWKLIIQLFTKMSRFHHCTVRTLHIIVQIVMFHKCLIHVTYKILVMCVSKNLLASHYVWVFVQVWK